MSVTTTALSLNEIRSRGYAALLRELGPTGYTQFIRQFHAGRGNYTEERRKRVATMGLAQVFDALDRRRSPVKPARARGDGRASALKVRLTGTDSIIGYGISHVGRETVLAEHRRHGATFYCRRGVYESVAKALHGHPQGLVVRELIGCAEVSVGHEIPDYQVRVPLRLWQRLEPPLVIRFKGSYQPANDMQFVRSATAVWESLPVDEPPVSG